MLVPYYTNRFKKDTTRCKKRGCDISKLVDVISHICSEDLLPEKYRDHKLSGNYTGCRDCHIESDWLLIYTINEAEKSVTFIATGTHSDLF